MHFHHIFLLPIILMHQIKISNTSPILMKFSQDDENNNLIKYITKGRYKLVGIKLRFKNDSDNITREKAQEDDDENATTNKYLNLVALDDDKFKYINKDKTILRLGWNPAKKAVYIPKYPSMGRKEPVEEKDYLPGCPPGFHKDNRPKKVLQAEADAFVKQIKLAYEDNGMTSEEKKRKRRRDKDMGVNPFTPPPIRCRPNLEREYTNELYIGFKHTD